MGSFLNKQTNRDAARGAYARSAVALGGQYRKFFGASVAAVLLLQITIVTDTIIVGELLGPIPMSGIRVASPIVNLLNVIGMLVGVGSATLVSIAIGRRDKEEANRAFTLGIVLSIVCGALFALAVAPFAEAITHLISSDDSTLPYTATFLRIVTAASPVYILASVMALLLRADSYVKLSSVVLAVAGVANVVFDLLFMGALGMGVEGSAYATDLGMLVAVLASLLYVRWPNRTLSLCKLGGAGWRKTADVVKNGAPGALRMLFACISLLFLNYVVGSRVGVEGIALLTVCGNVQLIAMALFSAGGQAAMPMEGVLYGERDYGGLRLLVGYVFRIVLTCVAAIMCVTMLFPDQIVNLFVPGGISENDWLLRLYAIGFLPLALNYVMVYYYNTIQQRTVALVLTLLENLVLYMPFIWFLTNAWGLTGAILAFVFAEALAFGLLVVLALHLKRKQGADSILLIPSTPREIVLEATAPASNIDAAGIAHRVKEALDSCGVDSLTALRCAVSVEEMVADAAASEHNQGRDVLFDIIVSNLPDCVQVSMRDNGSPFDPTITEEGNDRIETMRSVASRMQHTNAMGMNQTIIEVDKANKEPTEQGEAERP